MLTRSVIQWLEISGNLYDGGEISEQAPAGGEPRLDSRHFFKG